MGVRCRRKIGPPGPSAAGRPRATSRSARRRRGSATCWTRRGAELWYGPVSPSRRRPEWLRYVEQDRDCKPSTLTDYRAVVRKLLPESGSLRLGEIAPERIEAWRSRLGSDRERPLSNRIRKKALTILGGILERAHKVHRLPLNPPPDVETLRERYDATRFDFYSPEDNPQGRPRPSRTDGAPGR
jgi:hypothetical protein